MRTIAEPPTQALARAAGGLYLVHFLTVFLMFYMRAPVAGADPLQVMAAIAAHRLSYGASILAAVLTSAGYVAVTALLYTLLKPGGRTLSLVAAMISLTGCALGAMLTVPLLVPLVLSGSGSLAFAPEHVAAIAGAVFGLAAEANAVPMIFFGLYCLMLGALLLRGGLLPLPFAILLVASGTVWLGHSVVSLLAPSLARGLAPYLLPVGAFGEAAFAVRLTLAGRLPVLAPGGRGLAGAAA
jgi:hypothetical protein